MSWQNEMVRILRFLINDIDSSTYSDSRLEETLLVAAQLQYASIDFDNTYSIDIDTLTLSPDPTTLTTKDDWFINIVCVKAACIVLGSEAKTMAAQSYKIKDGPSSIETGEAYRNTQMLYKDMCDKLAYMIVDYKAGNSVAGHAVLTPYTQERLTDGNPIRNFS